MKSLFKKKDKEKFVTKFMNDISGIDTSNIPNKGYLEVII